jgi:hypothetical protein
MNNKFLKVLFFFIPLIFSFNSYSMVNVPEMDYVAQNVSDGKIKEFSRKIKNYLDSLDERDEGAIAIGCFGLATVVAFLIGLIVLEK